MGLTVIQDSVDKRLRHSSVNLLRRCGLLAADAPELKGVTPERVTIPGICRQLLRAAGVSGAAGLSDSDAVRAALNPRNKLRAAAANSTADLSSLLGNVQNKALMKGYQAAKATWRAWCKKGSLTDFKVAKRVQLTDFAQMRETGENGEIIESKIGDRGENIQLAYYARSISLTHTALVSDDLQALAAIPEKMGQAAAQLPSRLVYAHLLSNPTMSDGVALFHASHGNLETGATSNLDETNKVAAFKSAIKAFRKQTAPQAPNDTEFAAEAIDLEPAVVIVPPEHEYAAYQLANPNLFVSENQFFKGKFDVQTEARLSNASYTGYSTTAWYMAANPEQADVMEVAFLDGNEAPQTDTWEDFDRLAIRFRAVLSCGVRALDWRGIVKSAGA